MLITITMLLTTSQKRTRSIINAKLLSQNCDPGKVYTDLNEALINAQNVCFLNLSNQNLGYLTPLIKTLTNLKELNLASTNLTKLPDEIGFMDNLLTLNLSNNNLTELPITIDNLEILERLDVSNNPLAEETILSLPRLLPTTSIIGL